MPVMEELPPMDGLAALSDDTLRDFRQRLALASYDEGVLAEAEAIAPGLVEPLRRPLLADAWHHAPTPARDLALLLYFGCGLPAERGIAALGADTVNAFCSAGVLFRHGDALRCAFVIAPMLGLWVLSDDLHHGGEAVMGPGPTTHRLAQMIPDPAPKTVLDVGCGAGSLALRAGYLGAREAVGVDISPRAVAVARFNARLNAVTARFEVSDLFGAVREQRFDFIVSQPAFIAAPPGGDTLTFAHGGTTGDELSMRLFAKLPEFIAPGGAARILVESAVRLGVAFHARVREAFGRAPVDLLMLSGKGADAAAYSAAWASIHDRTLGPRWTMEMLRYRAHLRTLGIESFTHALAVVTAPVGARAPRYTMAVSVHGLRGFDAEALGLLVSSVDLAARTDAELLAATVCATPWAEYVEERPRPDDALPPRWLARFHRVAFADRELTEPSWVLLGILDRSATVAEAVQGFAEACGAEADDVRAQVLGFVRESLATGLVNRV